MPKQDTSKFRLHNSVRTAKELLLEAVDSVGRILMLAAANKKASEFGWLANARLALRKTAGTRASTRIEYDILMQKLCELVGPTL